MVVCQHFFYVDSNYGAPERPEYRVLWCQYGKGVKPLGKVGRPLQWQHMLSFISPCCGHRTFSLRGCLSEGVACRHGTLVGQRNYFCAQGREFYLMFSCPGKPRRIQDLPEKLHQKQLSPSNTLSMKSCWAMQSWYLRDTMNPLDSERHAQRVKCIVEVGQRESRGSRRQRRCSVSISTLAIDTLGAKQSVRPQQKRDPLELVLDYLPLMKQEWAAKPCRDSPDA